jgi:hypothetical protein
VTIIKASCPTCGDVLLQDHEVRYLLHPDPARSFYQFTCSCGEVVRKPADAPVARLLVLGGVEPEVIPAEAVEVHDGPPLTVEDWARFLTDLDDIPAEMIAAEAG